MPQVLVATAAAAILAGRLDLALVVGAEALATVRRLKKAGRARLVAPAGRAAAVPLRRAFHPAEVAHDVFQAYLTFAAFDNARRAHLGPRPRRAPASARGACWPR